MADQGNSFYSGSQNITNLVNGVNTVLTTMQFTNNASIHGRISFVDNGSTTGGTPIGQGIAGVSNGEAGKAGDVMYYPLSPVSNPVETMPLGIPRSTKDAVIVQAYVERKPKGVTTEKLYFDKQDPYGVLNGKQGQIISRAGRAVDLDFVDLINGNYSTTYDGLSFFNTAHPIKPGSSVVASNDVTCTAAEWASGDGLGRLLETLAKIPWFDGALKDGAMSKPLILCPSMTVAFKARTLVGLAQVGGMTLIPQVVGAGVATGTSPYSGMVQDVVHFQDLANPATYADSDKYVYAIATMGAQAQPAFITSPKRYPVMNIYGLDPSEEFRRVWRAIGWDWDGFWGVGYGLWQCAVRMKIG